MCFKIRMKRQNNRDPYYPPVAVYEKEEDELLLQLHAEASSRNRKVWGLRASELVDFSSQFGSGLRSSFSYSARNFLGRPARYPEYGEKSSNFQFHTYGNWWRSLPSFLKWKTQLPFGTPIESIDYIDFKVERRVQPVLMLIYEVFNPGSIVKIFCYNYNTKKFVPSWQGEPQFLPQDQSHRFMAKFPNIKFSTDRYRIEFNHAHLDYFTGLDGMYLYGEEANKSVLNFLPMPLLTHVSQKQPPVVTEVDKNEPTSLNPFESLPSEVMHYLLSLLDLRSLCSLSQVCWFLKKHCYDPMLYRCLNLQIYWHLVTDDTLKALQSRLTLLQMVNLSWCGRDGRVTPAGFIEFIERCCRNVTRLQLSNCNFIDYNCMKAIADNCLYLKELELRCLRGVEVGFISIAEITGLIHLDLYYTLIDEHSLLSIIRNCRKIEHLFIGSCAVCADEESIAIEIGKYLTNLKSLELWTGYMVTCDGIRSMAENCHDLIELNLGWCCAIRADCGCLREIISANPKLKKLFLTSLNSVKDVDLHVIALSCPDLEQLDLLGLNLSLSSIRVLLSSCKKLKLLDIGYSTDRNTNINIDEVRAEFPHVDIKFNKPI